MSTISIAAVERRESVVGRLLDYVQLTKPRIVLLELVAVAVAMSLAGGNSLTLWSVLATFIGTTLVGNSASAGNQWLERHIDARMHRTGDRPLPAGRLDSAQVISFALAALLAGGMLLAWQANWLTACFALITWGVYVVVYTPLKQRTPANTAVGAVAGALPVFVGWAVAEVPLNVSIVALAIVSFLWQFPHFMAIAWLYRHEYSHAGLKMLPCVEPTGMRAGYQAVLAAAILCPISLLPATQLSWDVVWLYVAWSLLLGTGQFVCAVRFLIVRDQSTARVLLRASLVYLPALLIVLWLTHQQI